MNKLPPPPRLLIEGDVAAASPYIGLAKKLARTAYQSGVRAKSYLVAVGTTIRVENYPESYLSKVFIRVIKKEELYAFIFLPKLIYAYRHPNASEPPWSLPDSIPVLPTADTNTNQYQAKYQYFPPKPPKTDWNAAVKLLDKNYRYGNQNFFYKNDIYSWWHSAGGDLAVGIIHPGLFAWTTALGIQAFPVNEVDGASVPKSSLERLPCYTPMMTTIVWYDNEGNAQSEALYLFGYFVEGDDRYYWYQLKPNLYKNNKSYYDFGQDSSGFITYICGVYIGDILFSDEQIHKIEVIVYQVNIYMTPGDVDVFVLVTDKTLESSFSVRLYNILGGPLIMNGLNWPIRFSEDGFSMAGLFHCAEGGNRSIGYINQHIRLIQFSIDYEGKIITRESSERFTYTINSSGETPLSESSYTNNLSNESDLSYDTRVYFGGPCPYTNGTLAKYRNRITDTRTVNNEFLEKDDEANGSSSFLLAIAYKENTLVKAELEYSYTSNRDESSNTESSTGNYANIWTETTSPAFTLLAPTPQSSSNIPQKTEYSGSWAYINFSCTGQVNTIYFRGAANGTDSYLRRGSQSSILKQSSFSFTETYTLKVNDVLEVDLYEYTSTEDTSYTSTSTSTPSHPTEYSYDDTYYGNLEGGAAISQEQGRPQGGTFYQIDLTDWRFTRYDWQGSKSNTLCTLEKTDSFFLKKLSYLSLKDDIYISLNSNGAYDRIINSTNEASNVIGKFTEIVFTTSGFTIVNNNTPYDEDFNISQSNGGRYSTQTLSVTINKYGESPIEKYIAVPQTVEREDSFSNDEFISSDFTLIDLPYAENSDTYDIAPANIFAFMDLGASVGVAARKHDDIDDSVYLASYFYQKINFYFGEQDSYSSYFPFVDEFYSYQLKGIDTNVPPKEGSSLQEPTNPDDIDIGNQLCPIGFLKT